MIQVEIFYVDDKKFTRTYSDQGKYVVRNGISYEEACDPIEFNRTYIEGDLIPIITSTDDSQEVENIVI